MSDENMVAGCEASGAEMMADAFIRLLDKYIGISNVSTADTLGKIKKEVSQMKKSVHKGRISDIIAAWR